MLLAVLLVAVGLAGTLFFLAPAVEIGNWDLYANPWLLVLGVAFFIVFLAGIYRFRRELRRRNAERRRR
jgi:4-hydroxybenzoate polyprenyltransferase